MAQDPNENRISGIGSTTSKSPAERAAQIRELQEAALTSPVPVPVQSKTAQAADAPAKTASGSQAAVALFDVNPVANVNKLSAPSTAHVDSTAYGANQADPAALFGTKGADIEVTGVPWKVIPFGPSQVMDLKKPDSEYNVTLPPQAVVTKQGKLFEMTVAPKVAGSEPTQKRAVLTGEGDKLKGADWRTPASLKKGIESIPDFAMSLFSSIFRDTVKPSELKDYRLISVDKGTKSAFEVKAERKSQVDGKWKTESATLNNFGLKVPPANDARRHDINIAMYYLDRFQAS